MKPVQMAHDPHAGFVGIDDGRRLQGHPNGFCDGRQLLGDKVATAQQGCLRPVPGRTHKARITRLGTRALVGVPCVPISILKADSSTLADGIHSVRHYFPWAGY